MNHRYSRASEVYIEIPVYTGLKLDMIICRNVYDSLPIPHFNLSIACDKTLFAAGLPYLSTFRRERALSERRGKPRMWLDRWGLTAVSCLLEPSVQKCRRRDLAQSHRGLRVWPVEDTLLTRARTYISQQPAVWSALQFLQSNSSDSWKRNIINDDIAFHHSQLNVVYVQTSYKTSWWGILISEVGSQLVLAEWVTIEGNFAGICNL